MENKENKKINVNLQNLKEIRQIDPRLASYNIEMAEVTGGTFWNHTALSSWPVKLTSPISRACRTCLP